LRELKPGSAGCLLALLWLGSCCVEESPSVLFYSSTTARDLAEACRISRNDTYYDTAAYALADYLGHLIHRPSDKPQCIEHYGSACQMNYPCDEPPDLGDCPDPIVPPRRYSVCFGCNAQPQAVPYRLRLDPSTYGLLERVVRESGSQTREEALHKAILYYQDHWLNMRKDPNFYKDPNHLPHYRKPDESCPSEAELKQRKAEVDTRSRDGGGQQ
jgi:hypothetical protein